MTAASPQVSTEPPLEREPAEYGPERMVSLLLAAVPEDLDRFDRRCGNVQDWEKLIAYARSHGVVECFGITWPMPRLGWRRS